MIEKVDIVNIPKKYFLGIKDSRSLDAVDEKFPLAFATPFDKDDSAFQKRKETVENWAKSSRCTNLPFELGKRSTYEPLPGEFKEFENKAMTGFQIFDSVSRWSTQNKWFNIRDPRGFTLQISAECLADLIADCTIEKGFIKEELIWARRGSQNVLIHTEMDSYKRASRPSVSVADLKVNDVVIVNKFKVVYQGLKYVVAVNKVDHLEFVPDYPNQSTYYHRVGKYKRSHVAKEVRPKERLHVFSHFEQEKDNNKLFFFKTVKIQSYEGHDLNYKMNDFKIYKTVNNVAGIAPYYSEVYIFDAKEKADAFKTEDIISSYNKEEIFDKYPGY